MTEMELMRYAEHQFHLFLDPNATKQAMLGRLYAFCVQVDE
jgi:hypothetical protein